MKKALSEFNRLMGELQRMTAGESEDVIIPVLTAFLAACGPMTMKSRDLFKLFVSEQIDAAYNDFERRKQQ